MEILETVWWISLMVISAYHFIVFRIQRTKTIQVDSTDFPGVSIVVAVKNGSKTLVENVGQLCDQHYPTFEIIIVDDHSDAAERSILEKGVEGNNLIRLIHSDRAPGKKQALSLGIQEAKHDFILCTDADCYPKGPNWIRQMATHTNGKEMVLGYSPYEKKAGFLNRLIRFETIMTGMQYLSWAMVGRPYMGVGRNMLYPRSLFLHESPYDGQQHIPYGDDDLWVQQAANNIEVKVCFDKEAHVFSSPATSLSEWLKQKHRHLSAGHHYAFKSWWQPAGFATALILHWIILLPLVLQTHSFWVSIFFALGLLLRWRTHILWTNKLGDKDTNVWFPLLEIVYAIYLAGISLYTSIFKKKAWN